MSLFLDNYGEYLDARKQLAALTRTLDKDILNVSKFNLLRALCEYYEAVHYEELTQEGRNT